MENWTILTLLIFIACSQQQQQTPVIGGSCDLGSSDIQIGGKKTQFYLKCEPKDGVIEGRGTWVVKSRNKALSQETEKYKAPTRKQAPPTLSPSPHSICELDTTAIEGLRCSTQETCLQVVTGEASAYLQCDSSSQTWIKRHCQPGLIFSFEQQLCLGQKRHVARQAISGGILCTYSACSNSNPCSVGSCNNGYCCSQQGSSPSIIVSSPNNNGCNNCNNNNNGYTAISICPNGGTPYGTCIQGMCANGYSCTNNNVCCPSNSNSGYTAYAICPSGTTSGGSCYNNQCGSGCSCNTQSNTCCCQQSIFCPDGTQAAGACVSGQCGAGFSCNKGLCCASTSQTPKCLDGSEAIGACIDCKCGTGYTCTTGNLCCPASTNETSTTTTTTTTTTALGTCPTGQTNFGPCLSGACATGQTCVDGISCCGVSCPTGQINEGPCISGGCPPSSTCVANLICCGTGTVTACPANTTLCTNGACQAGATCFSNTICCGVTCPTGQTNFGPCLSGACDVGQSCVSGLICCGVGCPTGQTNLGPCNGGMCQTGATCVGNTICCGATSGVCVAAQSSGPCQTGMCSFGFTCDMSGANAADPLCCPNCLPENSGGPCDANSGCSAGFLCDIAANLCCPILSAISAGPCTMGNCPTVCPAGQTSIGPCINNMCPTGYTCVGNAPNQQCCGAANLATTCNPIDAMGPCVNGNTCPPGYSCDTTQQQCCPNFLSPVGRCLTDANGTFICPTGTACKQSDNPPQCYTLAGVNSVSDDPCEGAAPGSNVGPFIGSCPGTSVSDGAGDCICP